MGELSKWEKIWDTVLGVICIPFEIMACIWKAAHEMFYNIRYNVYDFKITYHWADDGELKKIFIKEVFYKEYVITFFPSEKYISIVDYSYNENTGTHTVIKAILDKEKIHQLSNLTIEELLEQVKPYVYMDAVVADYFHTATKTYRILKKNDNDDKVISAQEYINKILIDMNPAKAILKRIKNGI